MATTTFNDLITFSRGSNATVTGPNGLIQWAPSNLLTNSQDFEASAWTKANATVTSNSSAAPDQTATADLFVPNTSSVNHAVQQSATTSSTVAFSVYAKASGYDRVVLSSSSNNYVYFNLANGTVESSLGTGWTAAIITDAGNGWYRCTAVTSTAQTRFDILPFNASQTNGNTAPTFAGNGTSGIQIWGAQLELGSTATTYNNTSVRNLLGFSEAFDGAGWSRNNSVVVTGAQANPVNGLFNAQKLMENTATNTHQVQQGIATIVGTPYTASVYAKAAERTWVAVQMQSGTFAYVNLVTGALGNTSGSPAVSIISAGNGWWRIGVTAAASATSSTFAIYTASANGTVSYTGDGNSGVYIYGAMLSNSASLDPYVPTPGAAPSSTAYYGPRFDYDPVTLLPRGLLIEEQRTNLHVQSEAFSSPWTTTRASVVSAAVQSPSGANSVIAFTEDATNSSSHELYQNTTKAASAITYTYSLYVKKAGRDWICVTIWDNSANGNRFWFNVNTGAKGSTTTFGTPFTSATYDIVAAPAGFYRVFVTLTSNTATNLAVTLYSTNADSSIAPATALNAAGLYVYGSQLEAGAFATSYIPTIASTVTRSADIATISGSLFSQWYNGAAGALIVESDVLSVANPNDHNLVSLFTSSTNLMRIWLWSGAPTMPRLSVLNVTTQAELASVAGVSANTVFKSAAAYNLNDFGASYNGATALTDTSGTVPTGFTQLNIGSQSGSAGFMSGHIRSIRYVPVRAADFQLQQVTT